MSAISYKYAFAICNVVDDGKGNAKLDLPFQIYSQTICENNINHYCYLTNDLIGKNVLLYFAYNTEDEDIVKNFSGYKGDDWVVVQQDPDVQEQWSVTKADALATESEEQVMVKGQLQKTMIPYAGSDASEIIHPYPADGN